MNFNAGDGKCAYSGGLAYYRAMKEQGMSTSEKARRAIVSRETVRKYIAVKKPAKYSKGG